MSIRNKPEHWLTMIQGGMNDLELARFLCTDLTHYNSGRSHEDDDVAAVLALLTAIRLSALATTPS